MKRRISIIADFRESKSGIPAILKEQEVLTAFKNLDSGDYLVNDQVLIERKTNEDFITSLVSNRLFRQCEKLKRNSDHHYLLMEGNPFTTNHKISREAIKGAILSISCAWQIPIVYSKDKNETVDILILTGHQTFRNEFIKTRIGIKPKRIRNRQLYLLQGLPDIGPSLAYRLLAHFGSVKKIISATEKQLMEVEGLGKGRAFKLFDFMQREFR